MERFVKGDIIVMPFPFSDLSGAKRRPALVISELKGNDCIICQITTKEKTDMYKIELDRKDFEEGGLNSNSKIQPNKIFTADKSIILYKAGRITRNKIMQIEKSIIDIISR